MRALPFRVILLVYLLTAGWMWAAGEAKHVVVVVWDGLRPDFVSAENTPALHQLAQQGVTFANHHSVYCTATVVNGVAIATGVHPSQSHVIANNDYRPDLDPLKPVGIASPTVVARGDKLTDGKFLPCPTFVETLQAAGKSTAVVGTKTVALLYDRSERDDGCGNVCVFEGKSQPPAALAGFTNALGAFPSAKDQAGNAARDEWTRRFLTEALWSNGVPTFSLLWLSEPDATQHATGPGSKASLEAMLASDRQLAAVLAELDRRKVREQTDVLVVSDHGFSTVEKAIDVAAILRDAGFNAAREFKTAPNKGDIVVAGQGGSVLFFVIGNDAEVTRKLVKFLQQQEFTGVLFTRDDMPGTFPLVAANLDRPEPPDVVMSLRWSDSKNANGTPGMFFSDGGRRPGGGNHASLSRFDIHNTLIAAGPDFKVNTTTALPSANTDLAPTILWLLDVKPQTPMGGRVLSEALTASKAPVIRDGGTRRLATSATIGDKTWRQYLQLSQVNDTVYVDEGNGELSPK